MSKFNTKELVKILQKLRPAVDQKEKLELTNTFIFRKDHLEAFNDEFAVMYPLPIKTRIQGSVKAKEFYDFMSRVKDTEIDLKPQAISEDSLDKKLIVKGKKFESEFLLKNTFVDQTIKAPDKWYELPEDFLSSLKTVTLAVSKNLSTPVFACVHWKGNTIEATDNFRLVQFKIKGDFPFEVSVFGDVISKVLSYDVTHVAVDEYFVMFKTRDDAILACRIYFGNYPDLEQLKNKYKEAFEKGISIKFSDEFKDSVDRAEILAADDEMGDKYVDIKLNGKEVLISSASELGSYKETLSIENELPSLSFSVRTDLFKDVLNLTTEATLSDKLDAMSFETESLYHLVLLG